MKLIIAALIAILVHVSESIVNAMKQQHPSCLIGPTVQGMDLSIHTQVFQTTNKQTNKNLCSIKSINKVSQDSV